MKEIIIPIITCILGALISAGVTLYVQKRKEHREDKEKNDKQCKEIFDNRPEYKIVDYKDYSKRVGYGIKQPCDINVFMTTIEGIEKVGRIDAIYEKKYFNQTEWCCFIYTLENVGKTDINVTDIICNHKRTKVLFNSTFAQKFLEEKCLNYSELCDKKTRVGESITLKLCYHKSHIIESVFDAILSIGMQDVNGVCWEQPLFSPFDKLYDSYRVSSKDYRQDLLPDVAEECFRDPWKW